MKLFIRWSGDRSRPTVSILPVLPLDGMANVLDKTSGEAHSNSKPKFIRGLTNVLRATLESSQFLRSMSR